ncbi:hypothetical protein PIB30_042410 [Stylosanthes scabra]|uniref:Uncharacterized protein n=1 Tax=Stylosanthes scabra TaxID=79078 RepID=A0ABU6ZE10_9FABA|nr:hypothetical protein [Stylosanthes scabra]
MDTNIKKVTELSMEIFLPHTTEDNPTKLSKALGIKFGFGKKLKARKNIKIHSPASDDIPSEETKSGVYIPSVLNVFVSMLTHHERSLSDSNMNWYMPTTFSALYIEVMLQDATFYDSKRTIVLKVSKFKVVVPDEMAVERCGSNDEGIWVAQWMNECGWCDKYSLIDVDIDTWMRLALDLILHPYNLKRDVVVKAAQQNYIKIEKKCRALARK